MAFGEFDQNKSGGHTVAEINMIPLIDVMLVLLVIFMIAAPLMTHAVKIDLPKASSEPQQSSDKDVVNLAIDGAGQLFWNTETLNRNSLNQRLIELKQQQGDTAEVHLRADKNAPYHFVAETLADAAKAGITRIGFISEPEANHSP